MQSTVFDTSCLSQRPHAGTQTQTTLDPSALSSFSKVSDPRLSLSDSGFALNNHHPNSRADIGTTGSNGANVDWTLNWGQPSVVSAQVTEKDIGNDTLEQVDLDAWMKSNEMDFQSAVELALTNAPHLFPTGQEHFPYLHQLQLMEDPDGLAAFFQTIEQRHQVGSASFKPHELVQLLLSNLFFLQFFRCHSLRAIVSSLLSSCLSLPSSRSWITLRQSIPTALLSPRFRSSCGRERCT